MKKVVLILILIATLFAGHAFSRTSPSPPPSAPVTAAADYEPVGELARPEGVTDYFRGVAVVGDYAYVLGREGTLLTYDISSLSNTTFTTLDTEIHTEYLDSGYGLVHEGDMLYVYGANGVQPVDLTKPYAPVAEAATDDAVIFNARLHAGYLVGAADSEVVVYRLDTAGPTLVETGKLAEGEHGISLSIFDDAILVNHTGISSGDPAGYSRFPYSSIESLGARVRLTDAPHTYHQYAIGDRLVACTDSELQLWDISASPFSLNLLTSTSLPAYGAGRICVNDGERFVVNGAAYEVAGDSFVEVGTFDPVYTQADGFPHVGALSQDFIFLTQNIRVLVLNRPAPQDDLVCFPAVADTVADSATPDSNRDADDWLRVERDIYGERHAYLRFDLSALPADAAVYKAELRLVMVSSGSSPISTTVAPATDSWTEQGLTWNNRPPAAESFIQAVHENTQGLKVWDVTEFATEWASGARPNDGLIVQPTGDGDMSALYDKRDGDNPPELCLGWLSAEDDAQAEALDRLRELSTSLPEVRFDGVIPRFVAARIPVQPELAGEPVRQALAYLGDFADLYRLPDPGASLYLQRVTPLTTNSEAPDAGVPATAVGFGQRQYNIPVFGADIIVRLFDNQVFGSLGQYLTGPPPPRLEPALSSLEAGELARLGLPVANAAQVIGQPRLVYFHPALSFDNADIPLTWDGARLGWEVSLVGPAVAEGSADSWRVVVDALSGEILYQLNMTETQAGDDEWDVSTVSNNRVRLFCDANATQWFDNNGPTADYPGGPGNYPGGDADGDTAYQELEDVYDFFLDQFGWMGHNGTRRGEDEVFVHVQITPNPNAKYVQRCDQFQFSDGYVTDDILAHEFGHGVDRMTANLKYRDQSGAIDESLADTYALLSTETSTGVDPRIGEAVQDGSPGTAFRNMSNPPAFGDPDHMSNYLVTSSDNGGVHTNSGILNKAAFLLTAGGTHNGVTIEALGVDRVAYLIFNAHRSLSRHSKFRDFRDTMVEQARTARYLDRFVPGALDFSFSDYHVCQVINAYNSVGLGPRDFDCDGDADWSFEDSDRDTIPNIQDNCPGIANPGQEDADGDGTGDVCDGDKDNDGLPNSQDNCPAVANPSQINSGGDLDLGDACEDRDEDHVLDAADNCPDIKNDDQLDSDGDGQGDLCDSDKDNDGVANEDDNCALTPNPSQADRDGDGVGDACDNCAGVANSGQAATDFDSYGDACDVDDDNDGICDQGGPINHPSAPGGRCEAGPEGNDNCRTHYNPGQEDTNGDNVGLLCDGAELFYFNGLRETDDIIVRFSIQDVEQIVELPIFPCGEEALPASMINPGRSREAPVPGGAQQEPYPACPDWIGEDFETEVILDLGDQTPFYAEMVDSNGFVVAHGDGLGGLQELVFEINPAYFFLRPPTDSPGRHAPTQELPFRGEAYTLRLAPGPGAVVGQEYTAAFDVTTFAEGMPSAEIPIYLPLIAR